MGRTGSIRSLSLVTLVVVLAVAVVAAAPTATADSTSGERTAVASAASGRATMWTVGLIPGPDGASFRAGGAAVGQRSAIGLEVPGSVAAGDVMLLWASVNQSSRDRSVSAPVGWARLGVQDDGSSHSTLWWRRASDSDAGRQVRVVSSSRAWLNVQLVAYQGVTGAPRAVSGAESRWSTSHTTPALALPSGAVVVSYWSDKSARTSGWTLPSSVQRRQTAIAAGPRSPAVPVSSVTADEIPDADGGPSLVRQFSGSWRDDFDHLDPAVWRVVGWGCFMKENVTVASGRLRMTARPAPANVACNGVEGARINTYGKREWGPGTFSARIRFVTAPGSWQTFWLTGGSGRAFPRNGEVDIAEITGKSPRLAHHRLHSSRQDAEAKRCSQGADPAVLPDGRWHVYSATTSGTRVVFKVDGAVVGRYVDDAGCTWPFGDPMRIIFGARGGQYGGDVDLSRYPVSYEVDWVSWRGAIS